MEPTQPISFAPEQSVSQQSIPQVQNESNFFPPDIKLFLKVVILLFLVSLGGTIFMMISKNFSHNNPSPFLGIFGALGGALTLGWLLGVVAGLFGVIIIFFKGLIRGLSGEGFYLMGTSFVLLVIFFLVGGGTCLIFTAGNF